MYIYIYIYTYTPLYHYFTTISSSRYSTSVSLQIYFRSPNLQASMLEHQKAVHKAQRRREISGEATNMVSGIYREHDMGSTGKT